jgi:hypothetical protein
MLMCSLIGQIIDHNKLCEPEAAAYPDKSIRADFRKVWVVE